jgi:hypothetical protein
MPEQDTAAEEEEEDFNFDSEWKSFTHSETLETSPNLKSFLLTQSSRKMATENFSLSLDECLNGLNEAIHDILNDSVVPIHNETLVRFEACDADIVATMKSNHNRRAALTKCMEDANAKWTKQYQRLRQKIGQTNGNKVRFEKYYLYPFSLAPCIITHSFPSSPSPQNDVGEGEEEGSDRNSPSNSDSNITLQGDQGDDPDWDELGDSECNREKIRCFLHAREQFQSAEDALSQNLDDIHEGLKAKVEAIMQAAVDIHEQHHTTCMALEDDIQYHVMENCKRRACLQEKLEESAKQAQGLFANLLSRLSQKI